MVQEVCVFFFSWTSLWVLYIMNNVPVFQVWLGTSGNGLEELESVAGERGVRTDFLNLLQRQRPIVIMETGFAVLLGVFFLLYFATRHNPPKDPLFYVFAEFAFTCIISLTSALEYDGFVCGYMEFYQKWGEPYLRASYAIMMCYWEGVVHYFVYLSLIHRMCSRKPYRTLGLFWAGSLLANMVVFLPGIVVGKHSSEIFPAFWINLPFLVMPIWGAIRLFQKPRETSVVSTFKREREQKKALIWRPVDLLLVFYLLGAMAFTLFRGLAVLDCPLDVFRAYVSHYEPYLQDPVGFPKITMLLLLFHALPLLGAFVYGLIMPGCTWMLDWTVFTAGAIAQAQWCHVGATLHPHTGEESRFPESGLVPALILNLLFAVGPLLLALRCICDPAFFITPASIIYEKKQS